MPPQTSIVQSRGGQRPPVMAPLVSSLSAAVQRYKERAARAEEHRKDQVAQLSSTLFSVGGGAAAGLLAGMNNGTGWEIRGIPIGVVIGAGTTAIGAMGYADEYSRGVKSFGDGILAFHAGLFTMRRRVEYELAKKTQP